MQDIQRIQLQPAYILHTRGYRETSLLLDVVTPEYGRLSLVAQGAKQPKSSRKALLQPFRSLLLSWQGRGDLCTLTGVEEVGQTLSLSGVYLVCAYYMTELMQRLLSNSDGNSELFACYDSALRHLNSELPIEQSLRRFEITALRSLGLLPDLAHCVNGGEAVDANAEYQYYPEVGAVPSSSDNTGLSVIVSGEALLAMDNFNFEKQSVLKEAKKLMRWILLFHIGDKPIRSRELFHVYK